MMAILNDYKWEITQLVQQLHEALILYLVIKIHILEQKIR